MIQIQNVVEIDESTGVMNIGINVLEREDANDQEREYARLLENLLLTVLDEMKESLLKKDPTATVSTKLITKPTPSADTGAP